MFNLDLLPKHELTQVTTENGRYYIHPITGQRFDSVTTILKRSYDQSWLEEWKERVGEEQAETVSRLAAGTGNTLHKLMEDFVLGQENDIKLSIYMRKPLRLVKEKFQRHLTDVYGVELPLYSEKLKTAGTTDLFGKWKGLNTVIDYKNSKHLKSRDDIVHYFTQASIYASMIEELYSIEVPRIMIVMINKFDPPDFFGADRSKYQSEIDRIFNSVA